MNWVQFLLKSPRRKHVIKGIARIDDKHYYLDYIVFTSFQWYAAYEVADVETFDKNTLSEETDLFYNVETKTFSTLQGLPEDVFNNFKPIKD